MRPHVGNLPSDQNCFCPKMGCPISDQTQVPNLVQEEVEDGVETLSLCDLPLYGDDIDAAAKCDGGGRSSAPSEEERDQDLFEFSSGENGSVPMQGLEKIVFFGRIIHFQECPLPALCDAKSPVKDCPKKKKGWNATVMTRRMNRSRLFRWKFRLFRKPGTSYRKMKAEHEENNSDVSSWNQQRQRQRQQRTYSRGWSGKWYFLMFGSARFPLEMGLRDIKSRQNKRTNPSNMFGLSDYAEAEVRDNEGVRSRRTWGLLNILRCSIRGNGDDHHGHRNDVVKVSNGCFPIR